MKQKWFEKFLGTAEGSTTEFISRKGGSFKVLSQTKNKLKIRRVIEFKLNGKRVEKSVVEIPLKNPEKFLKEVLHGRKPLGKIFKELKLELKKKLISEGRNWRKYKVYGDIELTVKEKFFGE